MHSSIIYFFQIYKILSRLIVIQGLCLFINQVFNYGAPVISTIE